MGRRDEEEPVGALRGMEEEKEEVGEEEKERSSSNEH